MKEFVMSSSSRIKPENLQFVRFAAMLGCITSTIPLYHADSWLSSIAPNTVPLDKDTPPMVKYIGQRVKDAVIILKPAPAGSCLARAIDLMFGVTCAQSTLPVAFNPRRNVGAMKIASSGWITGCAG